MYAVVVGEDSRSPPRPVPQLAKARLLVPLPVKRLMARLWQPPWESSRRAFQEIL